MSNGVVERFQDDPLLVFGHFERNKPIGYVDLLNCIADSRKQFARRQQEGRPKMFVCLFLTVKPPR